MKAFVFACLAIVGIAFSANLVLSKTAFSTQERTVGDAVRVD